MHRPSHPRGLWDLAYDEALSSTSSTDLTVFAKSVIEDLGQQSAIGIYDPNHVSTISPELELSRQVWQLAKDLESKHKGKQWNVPMRGDISVSQLYGKVAIWAQKALSVGDFVAQIDPVHVGLPWAAVRLVLTVFKLKPAFSTISKKLISDDDRLQLPNTKVMSSYWKAWAPFLN